MNALQHIRNAPLLRVFLLLAIALGVAGITGVGAGGPIEAQEQDSASAPSITTVEIVSSTEQTKLDHFYCYKNGFRFNEWESGYYAIGDTIQVAVTFNNPVVVSGSPTLAIAFGPGPSAIRNAQYQSTDGNQVIFAYTVQENDEDEDGIQIPSGTISLGEDDFIQNDDGVDATLSHPALSAQTEHKVDGVRPTVKEARVMASTQSYPFEPHTLYAKGDMILVKIKFSEPVAHHDDHPPQVALNFDGDEKMATNGCSQTGYYDYVVQEGDFDQNGVSLPQDALTIPSEGYIKDMVGNDAVITHKAQTPGSQFKVDARDPAFKRARTNADGSKVVVVFDENLWVTKGLRYKKNVEGKKIADYIQEAMVIEVDGERAVATGASQSKTNVSIVLQEPIQAGQRVQVSYVNKFKDDPRIIGIIADYYENPLREFSGYDVSNNVTQEPRSPKQKPQSDPTDKPTNLAATTANGQVNLSWTPSNDESYTGQQVRRRIVGKPGWVVLSTLEVDQTQYVDTTGVVDTKYIYRVKAVNDAGQGKQSKPVTIQVE